MLLFMVFSLQLCAQSRCLPLVCDSDELGASDGSLLIAQIIRILQTREKLLLVDLMYLIFMYYEIPPFWEGNDRLYTGRN